MKAARPGAALVVLALLLVVLVGAPAPAQESPADLFKAAGQAHQAGSKCLDAARKPGANQFLENEKAIGHFEQALRLLERYMEHRPDDAAAENLMQECASLLFWCHKMSPMVDPEDIEPEPAEPPAPVAEPKAGEPAPPAQPDPAELQKAQEEEARALLAQAREFQQAHPDDGMGALAKLFYVSERFPGTAAGQEAKAAADELQAKLFAVVPVVAPKPVLQPLTAKDTAAIEKQVKEWLASRQRLRCASCKGAGHTECKKCDGTGELAGRAGRRSTCPDCRRGKVACKRAGCVEGIDVRALEKVVIDARAPYYQEKVRALLGDHKDAVDKFLEALAAVLSGSPRAPAEISRCATELGIAPVQLRDVIEAHGPSAEVARPFTNFSIASVDRTVRYTIRGEGEHEETVSFEQQDGKWYLRRIGSAKD